MTLPDGSNYDGEWKDAKKHGQGVFTFRFMGAELKYAGEFRNGRGRQSSMMKITIKTNSVKFASVWYSLE